MVPPYSHRVSRVRRYSGFSWLLSVFAYETLTLFGGPSHVLLLTFSIPSAVRTPKVLLLSVWPLPRSLATTSGISVDVFSSPYLDVSVQAVPFLRLFCSTQDDWILSSRVAPFGYPRIIACLQLPEAFRSLPRPSSPVGTKAFTVRPYLLHHIAKAVTTSTIPQSPFVTYCIVSLLGMHVYLVFCSCCSTTHFVGKRLLLSNRFLCHADVNFRFPSIIDFVGGPDRT